VLPRAERLEG